MPFAKGAKATPTYFRARSGALWLMESMRNFLLFWVTALFLVSCGTDNDGISVIDLDDQVVCIPSSYVDSNVPFWLKFIKGDLDNSYSSILFELSIEELRSEIPGYKPDSNLLQGSKRFTPRGVILSNVSAVSGFSHAGELLLEKAALGAASFEYDEAYNLHRVYMHDGFRIFWSFVRSNAIPENVDKLSILEWDAAYCSQYSGDETFTCIVQRVLGNIKYQTTIDEENFGNLAAFEALINRKISGWVEGCAV